MVPYTGFTEEEKFPIQFVEDIHSDLFLLKKFFRKFNTFQEELEHSENILLPLANALEAKDPYTKEHSIRVSKLAANFASFLDIPQKDCGELKKAGIAHDIGKIFLSTSLLRKPKILSVEEAEAIQRHVLLGEEICKPLFSMRSILPAIRNHHERWDGCGFPDKLAGKDIPVIARILAIVDSFDAMVSERCYSHCKSSQVALVTMKSEQYNGQWDPELLGYFLEMMRLTNDYMHISNV